MAIGEHLPPGSGPIGLASSDGFPRARLVIGIFAVAVSFGMSWRIAPTPADLPFAAIVQPIRDQLVTPVALEPLAPEIEEAVPPRNTLSGPATAPPVAAQAARPRARSQLASIKRHQLRRIASRAPARSEHLAGRKAQLNLLPARYKPVVHVRVTRKASDPRREYIAAREQVAALTGEDSGSAYLARVAARQNASRANTSRHPRNRHEPGRAAGIRS